MGCRQTGLVVLGPPGEPELEACKRSLGVDEVLDAAALAQRFPGFRLQAGQVAVLDSTAGVLFADRALRAAQVGAAGGMECFGMTRDGMGVPWFCPRSHLCHLPPPRRVFAAMGAPCGMGRRCCTSNLGPWSLSPPLLGCTKPPGSSSRLEPGLVPLWNSWVCACRCR